MARSLGELRGLLGSLAARQGWDFSCVRDAREPMPWDYVSLVRHYLRPADRVLDIGTGGGERFLELASHFGEGLAVDISPAMIAQAALNRRTPDTVGAESANERMSEPASEQESEKARQCSVALANDAHRRGKVRFAVMDAATLGVGGEQFDVVLNRHANVEVAEIVRVLRPGGLFITQQVARRNTLNLLEAFGWTPESFGPGWFQPVDALAAAFEAAGCRVMAQAAYDVRYWFLDVPSLLFWLTAVPLPEPFDLDRHWRGVNRILDAYTTPQGIETNEHRELLIVRKE